MGFLFAYNGWEAKVFAMSGVLHWAKNVQDTLPCFWWSVWVEEDSWPVNVNILPRRFFIAFKDFDKVKAFLGTGFAKEEAIVGKEEVGNDWTTPTNRNPTDLVITGIYIDKGR